MQGTDEQSKYVLRYHFDPGDVLHYELRINETVTLNGTSPLRNERIFQFRWTVLNEDQNGNAEIAVAFERVRLNLELPQFRFDSETDRPTVEPAGDPETRRQHHRARALIACEFTFEATSRGAVDLTRIVGAEAIDFPVMFTTSEMPALPVHAVSLGESWAEPALLLDPLGQMSGLGTHVVKGTTLVNGREAVILDCKTEWTTFAGLLYEGMTVGPGSQTALFDADRGRCLELKTSQEVKKEVQGGTAVIKTESTQRLLDLAQTLARRRSEPAVTVRLGDQRELTVITHSNWKDANSNRLADPDEITKQTQRFSADEKVNLAILVSGLKDQRLRFEVRDSYGTRLSTNSIPLAGDGVLAHREFAGLPPGMYSLHWYVADRFVHFMPLQILPSSKAEDSMPSEVPLAPKAAKDFLSRGSERAERGELQEALADYTEAIRLEPNNDHAYVLRSAVYMRLHDPERAIADASESIRLNPTSVAAILGRATSLMNLDRLDAAFQDATLVMRMAPELALPRVLRAQIGLQKGDYNQALTDCNEAIRLDPKNALAYRIRARLRLIKQEPQAIDDLDRALQIDPSSALAYLERGKARGQMGEVDRAIADFDESLRLNASQPKALLSRGYAWMQKGNLAKALADLDATLKLDPESVAAYHLRGDVWGMQDELDKSIADHTEVLQRKSDDLQAYLERGLARLLKGNGQLDNAIADFTNVLRMKPDHYTALCLRGDAWLGKKNYEQSLADHAAAILHGPQQVAAYHHRGVTWSLVGEYAKAGADFDAAMQLTDQDPAVLSSYALFLSTCPETAFRDGQRALKLATRAGELTDWKHPSPWDALAAAQAETGDFSTAVKSETQALALNATDENYKERLKQYELGQPYRQKQAPRTPRSLIER